MVDSIRRLFTSQGYQPRFATPVQNTTAPRSRSFLTLQSRLESALNKSPPNVVNCLKMTVIGLGDFMSRLVGAILVTGQENVGMLNLVSRRLAFGNHLTQVLLFFGCQCYNILRTLFCYDTPLCVIRDNSQNYLPAYQTHFFYNLKFDRVPGHRSTAITEVYAEKDEQQVIKAITRVG